MQDFRDFVKLGYMSKWLHHSGGTVCEPTDIPVNKRHLDMLHAHMTLSDKPFMGSVTDPSRAEDSVDMCKILFGEEIATSQPVMTSLININSPLTFDDVMMGALEVYASNMQACIISPFIVGGAMAPVSVVGTLTQVLAETLAGVAYSQLVRPGAPVIMGAFVTSIDMNSGAPTFGTPEASQILYGAGQLARRLGLPFRSGGALCGSKLPDAQAAYETANTLNAALMGGVNFMLHACGWLEGGLVASFEKFVLDADQLGVLHRLGAGVPHDEEAQAMDAIREVGPGGTTSAVAIRSGISRPRSGARRSSTTNPSRPGRKRARVTARCWPRNGCASCWPITSSRAWSPRSLRRWPPSSHGARPRCPTPSPDRGQVWRGSAQGPSRRAASFVLALTASFEQARLADQRRQDPNMP